MNQDQLVRTLNSIGKECFINYFHYFIDLSISNVEIAELIYSERRYTQKSCASRTSHARSIIKNRMTKEALEIIATAKIPKEISEQAEILLNNL